MRNKSLSAYASQRLRLFTHLGILCGILISLYPYRLGNEIYAPDWLGLIVLYWLFHHNTHLGYVQLFLYGILYDLLQFNLIGTESIGLLLIGYIYFRYETFFQFLPKIAQVITVLILLAIKQFCILWILAVTGDLPQLSSYFIPPLISIIIWWFIDRFDVKKWLNYRQV